MLSSRGVRGDSVCGGDVRNGVLWCLREASKCCCWAVLLRLDVEAMGEDWTSSGAIGEKKMLPISNEQLVVLVGDCCY